LLLPVVLEPGSHKTSPAKGQHKYKESLQSQEAHPERTDIQDEGNGNNTDIAKKRNKEHPQQERYAREKVIKVVTIEDVKEKEIRHQGKGIYSGKGRNQIRSYTKANQGCKI